ncbi:MULTISPECIES: hypothetical protein [unclassified Crossiella]|uniref:hypothetical protein n=1 Tax=unclassified Crossiella TaxID=2620835 RepID=UPI001FFFA2EF|nr:MULTISPECIES: hypothetical protein [unclassified Crossiella]MCK2242185.1 hypothetical protein [Crossiella sp. S99.2]MCK2256088.1 hypothetical protein [Crossiella sp. S99.1]
MPRTVLDTMTLAEASAELRAAGYTVRTLAASAAVIATLHAGDLRASVLLDPDTAVPAVALHRTSQGTTARLFERDTRMIGGRLLSYTLVSAVGHARALARQLGVGVA